MWESNIQVANSKDESLENKYQNMNVFHTFWTVLDTLTFLYYYSSNILHVMHLL